MQLYDRSIHVPKKRNYLMGVIARHRIAPLAALLALWAGAAYSPAADTPSGAAPAETVRIQVDPQTVVCRISPAFIGLGYETSAVAQPDFFSAQNTRMVNLYHNLSAHGLMRIGGNVSDHTRYEPHGPAAAHSENQVTLINQHNLADLGDFARATGWSVMWGLNLGTGSRDEAVQEALAVDAALGSHLQSLEIGNEVEALPRFKGSYAAYHAAYLDYKGAIRAVLPKAPFSGPDSIGHPNWVKGKVDWVKNFVGTEAGDLKLVTEHYYRGGAADPASTIAKLLTPDDAADRRLQELQQICADRGLAFRINEVNSFYGGGKPDVSDTFASALWALDYMFVLASYGADGINLETDINQLGWISHYSPIVHDAAGKCRARPEYYGMLAFALAGTGDLLKLALDRRAINLSAYATRDAHGALWVTVVNKDLTRDAVVELSLPEGVLTAEAFRLMGPALESKDHVTFAGAEVAADGTWAAGPAEKVAASQSPARVPVPHASALVVCLRK